MNTADLCMNYAFIAPLSQTELYLVVVFWSIGDFRVDQKNGKQIRYIYYNVSVGFLAWVRDFNRKKSAAWNP